MLDIGTEITKITLDSNIQCAISNSEMYTQTEIPFTKNKFGQTDVLQRNCLTQTDKAKERVAATQTAPQIRNDICTQMENYLIESTDASTNTEGLLVTDIGVLTEACGPNISHSDDTESMKNCEILDHRKEKSESPPLSSDRTVPGPSDRLFPFVSLFNPLAARIPIIGTLDFMTQLIIVVFVASYIILTILYTNVINYIAQIDITLLNRLIFSGQ